MRGVRRWLRLRSVERDVDEEIAFHFGERVRELEAAGLAPGEAREEAARQFGDERYYRAQLVKLDRSAAMKQSWQATWEAVGQTAKYALRGMLRSPGLSLGIVLAFALGIGANVTMYETVERLLLRAPAHIADPDAVRRVGVHRLGYDDTRSYTTVLTYPDYTDITDVRGVLHAAATNARQLTVGTGEDAEEVRAVMVTASYWPLMGVQPALGRFFTSDEDRTGATPVVVLSHARWQSEYGGRADVLGQTLDFGQGPYTIIGVTPRGFTGVDLSPVGFFAPFHVVQEQTTGNRDWETSYGWMFMQALVRLDPSVPVEVMEAEATTRYRVADRGGISVDSLATVAALPLLEARGPEAPAEVSVAKWLLGVSAVVLLIACLNVANLLLARMLRQRREIAIRIALGISRRRLIAQLLTEGVLLGLAGGAAALLLATWGGSLVQTLLLPNVDWSGGPSASVLAMILIVAILAGAASALPPALQAARRDPGSALRGAGGGITRSTARMRAGLAVTQAALSLLLLVGAGLFVRSLDGVLRTDFGLAIWELSYVTPTFQAGSITDAERVEYYRQAVERVRQVPGVRAASMSSGLPFRVSQALRLRAEGVDSIPRTAEGGAYVNFVGTDYFEATGIRRVQGRLFDDRDARPGAHTAVLNESFAAALWPGQDPLGRCLYVDGADAPCSEVVGVVADSRRGRLVEETTFQYYVPLEQQVARAPHALLIRTDANMSTALEGARAALLGLDSRVRYVSTSPLQEVVAPQLRQWRMGAWLFTLFGGLALLVAAIGLYSVLAFDVAQRIREIGLRTALGASSPAIMRLIMGRALAITALGVGLGTLLALLLGPRLRDMLYQVSPHDPLVYSVVIVTLCAVSLVAAAIPAWRAARVDPNVALRAD
jgi:putative ABC transport system permease protein